MFTSGNDRIIVTIAGDYRLGCSLLSFCRNIHVSVGEGRELGGHAGLFHSIRLRSEQFVIFYTLIDLGIFFFHLQSPLYSE